MKKQAAWGSHRVENVARECVTTGKTLQQRVDNFKAGKGNEKWLAQATLEEIDNLLRLLQTAKRVIERDGIQEPPKEASTKRLTSVIASLARVK